MFQKKEPESNYDIIIGPNSLIKGDIESEGSIRIDGKIFGNIKSLGNIIISENAYVKGDIFSVNVEIYGKCEGNVQVKGKINIHQNSTLIGDIVAKSFNTKEGSLFKGNCLVDPAEELVITIDSLLNPAQKETIHVDFTKLNTNERNKNKNEKDNDNLTDKQIESKKA
jgi:cytoskeletal protein CcmA (bactofilin family)